MNISEDVKESRIVGDLFIRFRNLRKVSFAIIHDEEGCEGRIGRKRERGRRQRNGIESAGKIGQLQPDPKENENVVIYDLTVGTLRGEENK